jgi:hypothetical protein
MLAKPREIVPVVGLEKLGVDEAFVGEVEVTAVFRDGVDVIYSQDVDQLGAFGEVANADTIAGGSDFRYLAGTCPGVG